MKPDASPERTPSTGPELATALVVGRARRRPWRPPARTLLASGLERNGTVVSQEIAEATNAPIPEKHFLIVDNRFGTPIHVFLELDPTGEPSFPGFRIRFVTLESPENPEGLGAPARMAIGQDPRQFDRFRMFATDRDVTGAGFIIIEPRYVGPNWPAYILAFRPGGEKPGRRSPSDELARPK